eukprot:3306759-Pyramimonas_sp.AAC.1
MPFFAAHLPDSRLAVAPPAQALPAAAGPPPPGSTQQESTRAKGGARRRTDPIHWARLGRETEQPRA